MHPEKHVRPSILRHADGKMNTSTADPLPRLDSVPPESEPCKSQQFYLRWNNFRSNLSDVFQQLLYSESYADVTLACEGRSIKAHKVVLSASSPYFKNLFAENPCHHPIIIICDMKWSELKAVVDFMYRGEINVSQEQIDPLLRAAESLKIRGLANVSSELDEMDAPKSANNAVDEIADVKAEESEIVKTDVTASPNDSFNVDSIAKKRKRAPSSDGGANKVRSPTPPHADGNELTDNLTPIKVNFADKVLNISDNNKTRAPTWSQAQLNEAIDAVVQQKMRFTKASTLYGIPKGTLYDNILGKSKRMLVLQEADLCDSEERAVLEYCCNVSVSPFNRRTHCSLADVLEYVQKLRRARDPGFTFTGLSGFRWWWAFCKKHSIVSLYFKEEGGARPDGAPSKVRS